MTDGRTRRIDQPESLEVQDVALDEAAPGAVRTERVGRSDDDRPAGPRRPRANPIRALRNGIGGIVAVGVKELRGRVRGPRAFVILTFYLLFLGGFAWAWQLVAERTYAQNSTLQGASAAFASAAVGQEVFGALILVETLLVVFLAPALTAGSISLEREKQTLDMLTATPISSLAIVLGKLLSALAFVFLLIAASIPLTALVFVFGGVGPDDVVRAYAVLIVSAIGLGSLGLFISALTQRTQGATVVTFFMVLFLSLGTMFGVLFWNTMAGVSAGTVAFASSGFGPIKGRAPEAFLWFNPFSAQYDVICGASDGYGGWCSRLHSLTRGAITTGTTGGGIFGPGSNPTNVGGAVFGGDEAIPPTRRALVAVEPQPFGIRRDTFWPRSLLAWGIVSIAFILASIQLVSPTRRWRFPRRPLRRTV